MRDQEIPGWFVRLRSEIKRRHDLDRKKNSYRNMSLSANLGENYINQLMKSQGRKNPQIAELIKLCDYLDLSLVYVLTGVEMSQREEQFHKMWADLDDETQQQLMHVLRRLSPSKKT